MNISTMPRINTGDFVGSAWNASPYSLTPYAEAIAEHYPIQVPLFLTSQIVLSNTPTDLTIPRVQLTRPLLYDTLILGMSASQDAPIAVAGQAYLNITHKESGVPWVAPNPIGFAPLPAFAGMNTVSSNGAPVMYIQKLPDAFFLPRFTQLKLEWLPVELDVTPPVTIQLNMHGIQLINHRAGFTAPTKVVMPNGNEIEVGSRVPWFGCIPFGARENVPGSRIFMEYELNPLEQIVSYCPPSDCDLEIHDTYASFLDAGVEFGGNPSLLLTKLDKTRVREDWTPQLVPVGAVYGRSTDINPTMPFPKPQLLQEDRKLMIVAQNNTTGSQLSDGTVTFRGVRQCKY